MEWVEKFCEARWTPGTVRRWPLGSTSDLKESEHEIVRPLVYIKVAWSRERGIVISGSISCLIRGHPLATSYVTKVLRHYTLTKEYEDIPSPYIDKGIRRYSVTIPWQRNTKVFRHYTLTKEYEGISSLYLDKGIRRYSVTIPSHFLILFITFILIMNGTDCTNNQLIL